jgi:hypothetical protein
MSDDCRKGGLSQEILSELPKGAEAAGGQNFADLGCVQS